MIFVLAAVAAQADVLSASPGLPLALASETAPAVLFAILLGCGVVAQIVGRYRASRVAFLLGAGLVLGAGLLDRDPVLVVGQLLVVAALWPSVRKKARPVAGHSARK